MSKPHFGDVIADFEAQMGISRLEYLHVAVRQARYYGMEDVADWLQKAQDRLEAAVREEWNAEPYINISD
jgi:hypothetical protein